MSYAYHASTWPLLVPPFLTELLACLDRDYGTSPTSTDDELRTALLAAGHCTDSDYMRRVYTFHKVRRYETKTGLPF